MPKLLRFLQGASYSRTRLIEMMLLIGMVSLGIAWLCSYSLSQTRSDWGRFFEEVLHQEHADVGRELSGLLKKPGFEFEDFIPLLGLLAEFDGAADLHPILQAVQASGFSDQEKSLTAATLRSWMHKPAADAELVKWAAADPPPRFANRLLGDFFRQTGKFPEAIDCYRIESSFQEAQVSRRWLIQLLIGQQDFERVGALRDDALFADAFDPFILRDLAIRERDLVNMLRWTFASQYFKLRWGLVGMALFAGLLWFLLCMKLGQVRPERSRRTGLCAIALLLGIASAHVTLMVSMVQEEWFGFIPQDELISGLIYAVAGIGLREEGIKLLFVLPLVPSLVKRDKRLDWLMVPAFVGLGFAAEENLSYFHQSHSLAAPSRFLTANFFHITATALTGQALCRLWKRPRTQGDDFIALFGMVVVIHGLYDALLMLPGLMDYGLFAFTAFIFLCYQFFGELRPLRESGSDAFSLTSMFLLAICLLFGMTLIYLGTFLGIRSAVMLLYPVVLEVAVLVYMFVREFREPIG